MSEAIQPTLYIDIQTIPPMFFCPRCGGECYPPTGICIRCERREP